MTCIGNSGPLPEPVVEAITQVSVRPFLSWWPEGGVTLLVLLFQGDLVVAGVLSGNRNFEGRVHPNTRANYLASPPLVIAYALAGTVRIDFEREPLGERCPAALPGHVRPGDVVSCVLHSGQP